MARLRPFGSRHPDGNLTNPAKRFTRFALSLILSHDSVFDPSVRDTVYSALEDVWVSVALRDEARAREIIDQVPPVHPFEMRYDRVEQVDWESCSRVLDNQSQLEVLLRGW